MIPSRYNDPLFVHYGPADGWHSGPDVIDDTPRRKPLGPHGNTEVARGEPSNGHHPATPIAAASQKTHRDLLSSSSKVDPSPSRARGSFPNAGLGLVESIASSKQPAVANNQNNHQVNQVDNQEQEQEQQEEESEPLIDNRRSRRQMLALTQGGNADDHHQSLQENNPPSKRQEHPTEVETAPRKRQRTINTREQQQVALMEIPIAPRQEDPAAGEGRGLRRSKRNRVKPLAFWKNERLVFGRNEDSPGSLPGIKAVIRAVDPEPLQRKRKRAAGSLVREQQGPSVSVDDPLVHSGEPDEPEPEPEPEQALTPADLEAIEFRALRAFEWVLSLPSPENMTRRVRGLQRSANTRSRGGGDGYMADDEAMTEESETEESEVEGPKRKIRRREEQQRPRRQARHGIQRHR
ncbi:hypothetical protein BGZ65_003300 [Modicella reniformis]|uniref:Uncharacterized protein n=1 Tax=Modicella reniformis TaxID=1440133 RepID=A0A9P6SML2_9FUNG|nr:hypothetical protein BGZ65_003300 [Modicella reniformis]